jgi:hypothetical protein
MSNAYTHLNPSFVVPGQDATALTLFIFGGFGTRKSSVAGTFPGALVLSAGNERGDKALEYLPQLYGVPVPPVLPIASPADMLAHVDWCVRFAKQSGFGTIIVDSLGFYSDLWISHLMKRRRDAMKGSGLSDDQMADAIQMRKQDWGALETHMIKDVAARLHSTGLNVIWIVNEKKLMEQDEKKQTTRVTGVVPYISGATAGKLPGLCDMIIYADKTMAVNNRTGKLEATVVWHTDAQWLTKDIRHRYALSFPEGRIVDPNGYPGPTFWGFYSRIPNSIYVPDQVKQAWASAQAQPAAPAAQPPR